MAADEARAVFAAAALEHAGYVWRRAVDAARGAEQNLAGIRARHEREIAGAREAIAEAERAVAAADGYWRRARDASAALGIAGLPDGPVTGAHAGLASAEGGA